MSGSVQKFRSGTPEPERTAAGKQHVLAWAENISQAELLFDHLDFVGSDLRR